MTKASKSIRCAIYTRKSSDEGLDQEFNSLDAQREASEAYVKSQTHEGWLLLPNHYDDGGYSGGSLDRPAIQHLLADIAANKVDVVVVYKIDRLTRSLADFARMVELFDKHDVSFVSVTQSFNTTSSMGRLTLNVLLSFAQFEREVTGERIRDKIAASKAKGMWMGGVLPLGYDLPKDTSRTLVLNEGEAQTVRLIFERYLNLGSVHKLEAWLKAEGIHSKQWETRQGKQLGGKAFSRGALYHLLRNKTYLGKIVHRSLVHAAKHPPILDASLFGKVQRKLDASGKRRKTKRLTPETAPLTGRIFDATGEPMSPTRSRGKQGRYYRYYVSASLQQGRPNACDKGDETIRRISATALEGELRGLLERVLPRSQTEVLSSPRRIEVHKNAVHLILPKAICSGIQARLSTDERIEADVTDPECLRLVASIRIRNRRGRIEIRSQIVRTTHRDPILIGALQRAHAMIELDARKLPLCRKSPESQYGRRLIGLAFLAPDLQQEILEGRQPADLTLDDLMAKPLPPDWKTQRALFKHV